MTWYFFIAQTMTNSENLYILEDWTTRSQAILTTFLWLWWNTRAKSKFRERVYLVWWFCRVAPQWWEIRYGGRIRKLDVQSRFPPQAAPPRGPVRSPNSTDNCRPSVLIREPLGGIFHPNAWLCLLASVSLSQKSGHTFLLPSLSGTEFIKKWILYLSVASHVASYKISLYSS